MPVQTDTAGPFPQGLDLLLGSGFVEPLSRVCRNRPQQVLEGAMGERTRTSCDQGKPDVPYIVQMECPPDAVDDREDGR